MKFSKLTAAVMLALGAQAASAAVISVTLDPFNSADGIANGNGSASAGPTFTTAGGGTFTFLTANPVTIPDPALIVGEDRANAVGSLLVSAGAGIAYTASLSYAPLTLSSAISGVQVQYGVTYSDLGGNSITPGVGTVGVVGVTAPGLSPGSFAYTGGNILLTFTGTTTRAWDVVIDDLTASVTVCDSAASGLATSYSSWSAFSTALGNKSCAAVPLPGTLALLGLGAVGAGLVARRRSK